MSPMIPVPSPDVLINGVAAWSTPFFQNILPLAYFAMGVILAAGGIVFLFGLVERLYDKLSNR